MTDASTAEQLVLFDNDRMNGGPEGTTCAFRDPAFAGNKNSPVHRWVPWIAGFSQAFVRGALRRHLTAKGVVLDPFAGVGTTLVEAILEGHDAIGFEVNPYAALVCRTKLSAYRLRRDALTRATDAFESFYAKATSTAYEPFSKPPAGFKTRAEFYSPNVLQKVLIVQDFIAGLRKELVRDLFRVAFASTMVTYSNYSYEPSLGRRSAAGKAQIEDFDVGAAIALKLRQMAQDIDWMRLQLNGRNPNAKVFAESFFRYPDRLDKGCVDLLVTSPPYLNNYHYNRNTRPHLYWLGCVESSADLKPLEEENFGKFWQTVRERERVDLAPDLLHTEIADCLEALRKKRLDKGIYGGKGWANYAACYFNDCYRFAHALHYVLKPGATALIVIGNSIIQGVPVPTDRYLGLIVERAGLNLVGVHTPRATRIGNSIIQSDVRAAKAEDTHQLYESVVEVVKP